MFYDESASDSTGVRLGGSVLNAILVVCGITTMTFLFVLCFKYRLYKVIESVYSKREYSLLNYSLSSLYFFGWDYQFFQFLV